MFHWTVLLRQSLKKKNIMAGSPKSWELGFFQWCKQEQRYNSCVSKVWLWRLGFELQSGYMMMSPSQSTLDRSVGVRNQRQPAVIIAKLSPWIFPSTNNDVLSTSRNKLTLHFLFSLLHSHKSSRNRHLSPDVRSHIVSTRYLLPLSLDFI